MSFFPVDFIQTPTSIPFVWTEKSFILKRKYMLLKIKLSCCSRSRNTKVNRAQMWYKKYPIDDAAAVTAIPSVFHTFVLCCWSTLEAASVVSSVFSTQTKRKPKCRQAIREASIHSGTQIGIYGKQDRVRPQVNSMIQLRWRTVHVDMPGQRLRSPKTENKMATIIGKSIEKYGWLHNTWAWFIVENFHFNNAFSYGPL